jgi:hypothetical protein
VHCGNQVGVYRGKYLEVGFNTLAWHMLGARVMEDQVLEGVHQPGRLCA